MPINLLDRLKTYSCSIQNLQAVVDNVLINMDKKDGGCINSYK